MYIILTYLFVAYCSSSEANGRNDTASYNLGLVCNTFVDNKEEENKVSFYAI